MKEVQKREHKKIGIVLTFNLEKLQQCGSRLYMERDIHYTFVGVELNLEASRLMYGSRLQVLLNHHFRGKYTFIFHSII